MVATASSMLSESLESSGRRDVRSRASIFLLQGIAGLDWVQSKRLSSWLGLNCDMIYYEIGIL